MTELDPHRDDEHTAQDGEYEMPVRVLRTLPEVLRTLTAAREDFHRRLGRNGLTVMPEADQRWWPIAQVRGEREATS